jgi:hypothetical protein
MPCTIIIYKGPPAGRQREYLRGQGVVNGGGLVISDGSRNLYLIAAAGTLAFDA